METGAVIREVLVDRSRERDIEKTDGKWTKDGPPMYRV